MIAVWSREVAERMKRRSLDCGYILKVGLQDLLMDSRLSEEKGRKWG
jgi:hypothetical protein